MAGTDVRAEMDRLVEAQRAKVTLMREGERPWTEREELAFGIGFLLDVAAKCEDENHTEPTFAREFRQSVEPSPAELQETVVPETLHEEEQALELLLNAAATLAGQSGVDTPVEVC
jgi:hypothetical protein